MPAHLGWVTEETPIPWWAYVLGLVGLALAFAIIWLVRTPYPGLKKRPPDRFG